MIGDAIYAILYNSGAGAVFAVVGNKIFPDMAPQSAAFPYIIYRTLDTMPSDDKDGTSGLDTVAVSIECYATAMSTARSAADGCRSLMDRKAHGTYGGLSISGIRFAGQNSSSFEFDPHVFVIEQRYELRQTR